MKYLLLHCCGQSRKLIVSLHGKRKAFMIWGDCLFMMPIDGNVKECSPMVTWGYFDIVLDNEQKQREWHLYRGEDIFVLLHGCYILYNRG